MDCGQDFTGFDNGKMKGTAVIICDHSAVCDFVDPGVRYLPLKRFMGFRLIEIQLLDIADRGFREAVVIGGSEISAVEEAIGGSAMWGIPVRYVAVPGGSHLEDGNVENLLCDQFASGIRIIRMSRLEFAGVELPVNSAGLFAALKSRALEIIVAHGLFTEHQDGIFLGRDVRIGKHVTLIAPAVIGHDTIVMDGCRIGPGTMIDSRCFIDESAIVEESMIQAGTYVGNGVKISQSSVSGNRVLDFTSGHQRFIQDELIISEVISNDRRKRLTRAVELLSATAVLAAGIIPFVIWYGVHSLTENRLPRMVRKRFLNSRQRDHRSLDSDSWSLELIDGPPAARKFFQVVNIARGTLGWFGNPPVTEGEFRRLDERYETMWLESRPGFFSLPESYGISPDDLEDCSAHCIFYSAFRGPKLNFQILIRTLKIWLISICSAAAIHPNTRAQTDMLPVLSEVENS